MFETILFEIASEGKHIFFEAAKSLVAKVKSGYDIRKMSVEAGRFFIDYETNANGLYDDMSKVLSEDNMKQLADEINGDSGYSIKDKVLKSLISKMEEYEIPRDYATSYANGILCAILYQLQELYPEKYDRFFQSEWREEQNKTFQLIIQKLDKVNSELSECKKKEISIISADQMDIDIRRKTQNPKIGIEFFSIDDENFKEQFQNKRNSEIIRVRARCREEAIYCIINELWQMNEHRAIFVVSNIESWNRLIESSFTNNIYIPWFTNGEIPTIENNTNIFIYTDGIPSFSDDEITLRPRTLQTIVDSLVKAGMESDDATEITEKTHGLFISMKRKLFYGQLCEKPSWVTGLDENVQRVTLLIGQWTEAEGDKTIISELSGLEYDSFIKLLLPYTRGEDPFVCAIDKYGKREYYLASVENSWEYLDVSAHDRIWKRFFSLFKDVINEAEKLFIYSTEEKIRAQLMGETLFWSSELRDGMIRSLIMKSFFKNDDSFQMSINELIGEILNQINNPEQWKYISNFFPDLCELAPEIVMDRLFTELVDSTGLIELFNENSKNVLFEKNYSINIINGIEEMLVQDRYASQGYDWLLKLDSKLDANNESVKNLILKVLCAWYNLTVFSSVQDKKKIAETAMNSNENAWDYIYNSIPYARNSIVAWMNRPKYRTCVGFSAVSRQDLKQVVDYYIHLLIKHIDFAPDRYKKMFDISAHFSPEILDELFDMIIFQFPQISAQEKVKLKGHIRRTIYKNRYFTDALWALDEKILVKYEELLEKLVIVPDELEYVYLFDPRKETILKNPKPYSDNEDRDVNVESSNIIIEQKLNEFINNGLNIRTLAEACAFEEDSLLGRSLALYTNGDLFDPEVFKVLWNAQKSGKMALDYFQVKYLKDFNAFKLVLSLKDECRFSDNFIIKLYKIQAYNTREIPEISYADEEIKFHFWKEKDLYIQHNLDWALGECKKYGSLSSYLKLLHLANYINKYDNSILFTYIDGLSQMCVDAYDSETGYYLEELLGPLQKEYIRDSEKSKRIIEIELTFSHILEWENMKCFQEEIKRSPELYAEIVGTIFKRDDKQIESNQIKIQYMTRLYTMAKFCPAERDGYVDEHELKRWIEGFRGLLSQNGQMKLFGFLLGRLLAFSPSGSDDYFPCEAVRCAVEEYYEESLIREYETTLINERGGHWVSAGREEKKIAERYKDTAEHLRIDYPKTSKIFYDLYDYYIKESDNERSMAENERF